MAAQHRKTEEISVNRRYVSERVLSPIVGRAVKTLQRDRLYGNGPFPFYKISKQVVYNVDECIAIIEASRVTGAVA